jgi:aspartyl-tRNA(Asn)/glutamyl-tRNA(Gln) amidotransferase subunit C
MISKEEIKKLADLARIDVNDEEIDGLRGDMDAILDYVGQIKEVTGNTKVGSEIKALRNVLREDGEPTESETYSKELVAEFPNKEKNYLKVKKILG